MCLGAHIFCFVDKHSVHEINDRLVVKGIELFFEDATFSTLRLKLSVIRSFLLGLVVFQMRISFLLDCFCIDSMAMPRMLSFWAGCMFLSIL